MSEIERPLFPPEWMVRIAKLEEHNAKLVAVLTGLEKELDSGRIDLETTLRVVREALSPTPR